MKTVFLLCALALPSPKDDVKMYRLLCDFLGHEGVYILIDEGKHIVSPVAERLPFVWQKMAIYRINESA
jgi:hypothetical protein